MAAQKETQQMSCCSKVNRQEIPIGPSEANVECGQSQARSNPISYKSLLRAGTYKSTFSADEVRQSLMKVVAGESHGQHRDDQPVSVPADRLAAPAYKSAVVAGRIKLHSRHKSIGRLVELVQSGVEFTSDEKQLQKSGQPTKETCHLESAVCSPDNFSRRRSSSTNDKSESSHQEGDKMSQTVESIRTLSIQLNRAVSYNDMSNVVALDPNPSSDTNSRQASFLASSSSKLGRLMGKKAGRMKEILLQNIGKAEKTSDEMFQIYEKSFYKQQAQAIKLQKELKTYISTLAKAHETSTSLTNCIQQSTGEYQSARHDLVCENLSQLERLQDDMMDKLRNRVLLDMDEYLSQFNELRNKIAKRHRKLIDFDSSRRVYELMLASINKKRLQSREQRQSDRPQQQQRSTFRNTFFGSSNSQLSSVEDPIQSATNQLVDEARLLKLREQYNYCKLMYETINGELYDELPTVYEKKMKHLLVTLQNFFTIETEYHSKAGKLFATAGDVIDELPMSIIAQSSHSRCRSMSQTDDRPDKQTTSSSSDDIDEYGKAASGSSGVGSSQGDSSHDSSSSTDSSPSDNEEQHDSGRDVEGQSVDQSREGDDEQEEENDGDDDGTATQTREQESDIEATKQEQHVDRVESVCLSHEPEVELGTDTPCGLIMKQPQSNQVTVKVQQISAYELVDQSTKNDSNIREADENVDGSPSSCQDLSLICNLVGEVKQFDPVQNAMLDSENIVGEISTNGNLYKVKTNYKYLAEDIDELCFEADEVIQVVEFDKSQEPEDGWLMGVREVNGQRGLFPANFTRPL